MSAKGTLLVVGLLLENEEGPKKLVDLFKAVEKQEKNKTIDWVFDAGDILPKNKDYLSFTGSLTTPPCEKRPVDYAEGKGKVSFEDTDFFEDHFFYANYREIQDLNSRKVLNFTSN